MDTTTIIYIVAAALILRVIIKVVGRYMKEQKNSDSTEESWLNPIKNKDINQLIT